VRASGWALSASLRFANRRLARAVGRTDNNAAPACSASMAHAVFLRAVNVGGHQTFRPSELAKKLADLGVTNVGAAGTFVVGGTADEATIRREFKRRMAFEPEMMIRSAQEIISLVKSKPFGPDAPKGGLKGAVSVMAKPAAGLPKLPLERPLEGPWKVKIFKVIGVYALSVWRTIDKRLLYPNEVVEKELKVTATTRGWNTITSIAQLLEAP
jgi:uncharacterized protein (DUF1697 family)